MKPNRLAHFSVRRFVITLSLLLFLAANTPGALAQVRYTLIDLGTFGGSESYASAINNHGQVVGSAYNTNGTTRAFLWQDGQMADLLAPFGVPTSGAADINDQGQVVGHGSGKPDGTCQAYLYSDGQLIDLGPFPDYSHFGPSGINNHGQVVGTAGDSEDVPHAFLYSNGQKIDLGDLGARPGTRAEAWAFAINDRGQVAGRAQNITHYSHAFLYSDGQMTDLGTFGDTSSFGYGINNKGQVVGEAWAPNGIAHAFLYSDGTLRDLHTWTSAQSMAYGINNHGQVVGMAFDFGTLGTRACLWDGPAMDMLDLNNLIPPGSGMVLRRADDINDNGQIVGYGINSLGQRRAFLLTPFRQLFISRLGANLALSWFTNAPAPLSLFESSSPTSPDWVAVTNTPVVTNQQYRVLISPSPTGHCFYCLQSQ